jgi:nonsense-mediated mRNA decay protein 3
MVLGHDANNAQTPVPFSLCATCGTPIPPNPANICIQCIRANVDITGGIPKQATLYHCKGCDRYLQPPGIWIKADLESRELLTLCLKRIKGLNKVRLVDASFGMCALLPLC